MMTYDQPPIGVGYRVTLNRKERLDYEIETYGFGHWVTIERKLEKQKNSRFRD